jgi:hypothetical protein
VIGKVYPLLYDLIAQPMLHPLVPAPGFTSRAAREIEKADILCTAQTPEAFFNVRTDRICTAYLL